MSADGENAVLIGDRVRYAIPLGLLGQAAHAAFVKRDLKRVFDYRERAVAERLQSRVGRYVSAIVWFRRDLRLHEHPALRAALDAPQPRRARLLPR